MQAYDQAVVSASKIISQAIISDLECVSYGYFRDQSWPVGSGEVESSHRYVAQCRMKIPGATWHPDNLNPMLALRVVRTCNWWDKFWTWRQAQNYVPVPEKITD